MSVSPVPGAPNSLFCTHVVHRNASRENTHTHNIKMRVKSKMESVATALSVHWTLALQIKPKLMRQCWSTLKMTYCPSGWITENLTKQFILLFCLGFLIPLLSLTIPEIRAENTSECARAEKGIRRIGGSLGDRAFSPVSIKLHVWETLLQK